jgi:hypothetical protein
LGQALFRVNADDLSRLLVKRGHRLRWVGGPLEERRLDLRVALAVLLVSRARAGPVLAFQDLLLALVKIEDLRFEFV